MDYKSEMKERMWQCAVPNDILSHISDLLPLKDWINFRGVCHRWREAPSNRSNITEFSKKERWCIFYDFDAREKDRCRLYQEGSPKSCTVWLPGLSGATCLMSSLGWLLLRHNNDYKFLHPFTLAEIGLPRYPAQPVEPTACQVAAFTALPTSTKCTVVLLSARDSSTLEVAWCYLAENQWTVDRFSIADGIVALSNALRRIPRFVFFCHCGNEDCTCGFLAAMTMGRCNLATLNSFAEELRTGERNIIKYADWCSKLRDALLDDWICRFGNEFAFSFCPFNECRRAGPAAFRGRHWIVRGIDASVATVVKAVWIEPTFPFGKRRAT